MSIIENGRISRRESLRLIGMGSIGAFSACYPRSPDTPTPKPSPEIVGFPVVLEMPFGGAFSVELKPPSSTRLNLNKTLTQQLLAETVKQRTAPINVSIYPHDWVRVFPNGSIHLISEQTHQSLPKEEQDLFKEGGGNTTYNPRTGIAQRVDLHIAAGRYFKAARNKQSMVIQNEFLPEEGLPIPPIIALNATFYHEVRGHALLRNRDYRPPRTEAERAQEERLARKAETEWVKSLGTTGVVQNDQLFLIPY